MTSYIVAGARTPIGKMSGSLAGFSAAELGAIAIKAALERANVQPDEVDHVLMGQVLMAGQGQVPARQAAVKAGIPMSVPAVNINKVCLSGVNTIYLAHQLIAAGDAEIVVAGGMESMTNAPYIAMGGRAGFRYGNVELADGIIKDGLFCSFGNVLMGEGTDRDTGTTISRDEQDQFAVTSNVRAAAAQEKGLFDDEMIPVAIPQRKGDPVMFKVDEGVRGNTTMESLGSLKPAFVKDGTITAGNASQISDGGSAVIVMSKAAADKHGVTPLGEIVSYGMVAGPGDTSLLHQPSNAINKALAKIGGKVSDIDLFELNEAFAAVGIASMRDLGITDEITNVNGGAIALGHPLGASGARLVMTAVNQLHRSKAKRAITTMCIGVGQGIAMLIERV